MQCKHYFGKHGKYLTLAWHAGGCGIMLVADRLVAVFVPFFVGDENAIGLPLVRKKNALHGNLVDYYGYFFFRTRLLF